MRFVIEIVGEASFNLAFVTVTKIGNLAALDIAYLQPPSPGEMNAVNEGIGAAMEMEYGGECIMLTNERMDDPQERQVATRKFFGGGQG